MNTARFLLLLTGICFAAISTPSAASEKPRVAVLGFELINTSLEPTSADEIRRLEMLGDEFRKMLDASGRFVTVDIPPDVQEAIARGPAIHGCNGCERDFAARAGADLAAWGTVRKVSNLILSINVYLIDARTGERVFARSVDIRGNTDESWRHGLRYLVRNYLLAEP